MKNRSSPLFVFASLLFAPLAMASAADPPQPLKVFVLAGQSNMQGQAVVDLEGPNYNMGQGTLNHLLRDPTKAPRFQHLRDDRGRWTVRADVWMRHQPEQGLVKAGPLTVGFTGYGGRHHFGPELQFGHVVGDHFAQQVLLIKTAWGGQESLSRFSTAQLRR